MAYRVGLGSTPVRCLGSEPGRVSQHEGFITKPPPRASRCSSTEPSGCRMREGSDRDSCVMGRGPRVREYQRVDPKHCGLCKPWPKNHRASRAAAGTWGGWGGTPAIPASVCVAIRLAGLGVAIIQARVGTGSPRPDPVPPPSPPPSVLGRLSSFPHQAVCERLTPSSPSFWGPLPTSAPSFVPKPFWLKT